MARDSRPDDPYADKPDTFDDETFGVGEEEGKQHYTYAEKALRRLQTMGLGNISRPIVEEVHARIYGVAVRSYFDGRMPSTLKSLSLDELSSLYTLFCNYNAYLVQEYSKIAAERSEASKQKSLMWSMIRMKHLKAAREFDMALSDQKCSDLTRYDKRFVEPDGVYEELNVMKDCLEAVLRVIDQNMKVLSREVTIREAKVEAEARGRGLHSRFRERTYGDAETAGIPSDKGYDGDESGNGAPRKATRGTTRHRRGIRLRRKK